MKYATMPPSNNPNMWKHCEKLSNSEREQIKLNCATNE